MRFSRLSIVLAASAVLLNGCRSDSSDAELNLQRQQLQQQAAFMAQQQQVEREKQEERQREERQFSVYKAAITSVIDQQQRAIQSSGLPARLEKLRQIDTSDCPPDFRTAFVDFIYDLEQVHQVDMQRNRLASDDSVNSVLVTQLIQIFTKSDNSAVGDALTDDQKLIKARELWIQQGNEADRALGRVAAYYGIQY